ncbi:hypothetical protein DBV15_05106 [Temnothorax longispinosus]|uniref:Uncharacterized protein n=1 Tax=Temnothorax longispinosus TaxID=300112 RepID=A0A4S2KYQ4_9HYME|nr:hypothetical protein DBV15_05106 [Temnothorax longispinosus]
MQVLYQSRYPLGHILNERQRALPLQDVKYNVGSVLTDHRYQQHSAHQHQHVYRRFRKLEKGGILVLLLQATYELHDPNAESILKPFREPIAQNFQGLYQLMIGVRLGQNPVDRLRNNGSFHQLQYGSEPRAGFRLSVCVRYDIVQGLEAERLEKVLDLGGVVVELGYFFRLQGHLKGGQARDYRLAEFRVIRRPGQVRPVIREGVEDLREMRHIVDPRVPQQMGDVVRYGIDVETLLGDAARHPGHDLGHLRHVRYLAPEDIPQGVLAVGQLAEFAFLQILQHQPAVVDGRVVPRHYQFQALPDVAPQYVLGIHFSFWAAGRALELSEFRRGIILAGPLGLELKAGQLTFDRDDESRENQNYPMAVKKA